MGEHALDAQRGEGGGAIVRLWGHGKFHYVEYRIVRSDGAVRWIEDYGHYVETKAGPLFYVFINDGTEKHERHRKELVVDQLGKQMREAHDVGLNAIVHDAGHVGFQGDAAALRGLGEIDMSHDIRTPLNAVVGYAELIRAHLDEAERVRAYTDRVLDASHQLLDVVNETLEISRMEAGHVQLVMAECSLSSAVEQVRFPRRDRPA